MPRLLLLKVWTHRKSAPVGMAVFVLSLLWPSIPLRSVAIWLEFLAILFPTRILYPFLAFLIASYAAIYFYNRWVDACCPIGSAKVGSSAPFVGLLLGACPACIPVVAFFLPLTVTITLSYYSWLFALGSIMLLVFAIYRMNGFRKI